MFIIFVYTILLILFSFASYCKYNRFLNIISVFTVIWCVFGSISALGLYGLRPPKLFIHLLAWVFISIVDVFSLLCVHKESCYRDFKIVKYPKRIALLQLISIILLLPTVLSSIQVLISTGSITQVRSEYFSVDSGYSNIFFSLLFGAIPKGMLGALIVYYIYVSFVNKEMKYLLYAFLNTAFTFVMDGGRTTLFSLMTLLLITFCYTDKKNQAANYIRRVIKKYMVYACIGLFAITLLRGSDDVFRSLVVYFSGSLAFLDYIIANPMDYGLNDGYLYGYMILGFITEPFVLILKVLGLSSARIPSYYFNICCQNFVDISTQFASMPVLYNNNTSILFFLYRDSGIIGVILGAVYYGVLISFSYNRWMKGSHFWGLCHLLICQSLFYTIMGYSLSGYSLIFTLISFRFLLKK